MRYLFTAAFIIAIAGCSSPNIQVQKLQAEVDSLHAQLQHTYKPGLGEFMSGIQVHHARLWFAGQAANWPLAQFEADEIKEAIDDINEYNSDRPEVKSLPMLSAPLDSIVAAIKTQRPALFARSYNLLTNTCNQCHTATKHEYNVICIPKTPPFSNQEFAKQPEKKGANNL